MRKKPMRDQVKQGGQRESTKRKTPDDALERISHDLRERVKELDCLYGISNLLERPGISLEEIIKGTLHLLPAAWQYPEVTCGRITLDGRVFTTKKFEDTTWKLASDIVVNDENMGILEVFYKEERPQSHEGPFLKEERKLIDAVAEKLGKIVWLKLAEKSLRESEERYRVLAEQVADGVTLLQEGKFLFVNRAFVSMFGFRKARSLIGKTPAELASEGFIQTDDRFFKVLDSDHPYEKGFKAQCVMKDGRSLWVEGHHSVIQFEGKPAVLTTVRDVTERVLKEIAMQEEAEHLRRENITLRSSMRERYRFGNIIGKSQPMQEVYELILRAASSNASVCIFGESGTGKELVARAVHELSSRRHKEFVTVNCGAIPEDLLESEFFGHKKGAFTGAYMDKAGYLDVADGGSLFLDEIGELSLNTQVKLLRAIDGGDYFPVGSNRPKKSDFRTIAATNRNLVDQVRMGLMREDFFYRVNVIPITLPPLRDRKEDIPLLVDHFLRSHAEEGKPARLPGDILEAFFNHTWPGNIRELQNVIHRYLTVDRLDFMSVGDLSHPGGKRPSEVKQLKETVEDLEKGAVLRALEQTRWNKSKAASLLGVSRRSLFRRMQKFGM
jgi:two-component system, NtrC family, response regulator HydG